MTARDVLHPILVGAGLFRPNGAHVRRLEHHRSRQSLMAEELHVRLAPVAAPLAAPLRGLGQWAGYRRRRHKIEPELQRRSPRYASLEPPGRNVLGVAGNTSYVASMMKVDKSLS